MDNGHMDHGHMNHGGHGSGEAMCQMSMLFTWDTTDLCIIFPSWHVRGNFSLIMSLLGVVVLTAGYEAVREFSRRYESGGVVGISEAPTGKSISSHNSGGRVVLSTSASPLSRLLAQDYQDDLSGDEDGDGSRLRASTGRTRVVQTFTARRSKMVKGLLYATQVFYSFFIMLLFMTYNGWVMLAVAVGAFVGFMAFGNSTATKSVACH